LKESGKTARENYEGWQKKKKINWKMPLKQWKQGRHK
jgi:hypothetical protein